ncbi:MAG: restriction endonuclease, SacI family [Anaerolineae bacterium]|jgi:DNA adenine methylase|nr:restriction endonuclease, SacI family [Anaerolineae bacterium]
MSEPTAILDAAFQRVSVNPQQPIVAEVQISQRADYVCKNLSNRAGVRLLMACLLAKIHVPIVDVRKPYTNIEGGDSFSGRAYDEQYITSFINQHNLPCNSTTAFLTPALRNRNATLVKGLDLVGRPPQLYITVLDLLDDVYSNRVAADDLLAEIIRLLILLRDERQQRIESLIGALKTTQDAMPLSSEDIVNLIAQHLSLKRTSRLPVLLVAAAYNTAAMYLGERVLALQSHNAADLQTGALGDVEITLIDDDRVVTSYEMKDKRVTREDIERALQKLSASKRRIDNYIFITTDEIDKEVQVYARSLYADTGGIEFVILDCIGFVRHYLHLFHRLRADFLEEYQTLILAEPESSVSQPVKEAFLSMRQTAEMD